MHDESEIDEKPKSCIYDFFREQKKLAKAQRIKVNKNFDAKIHRIYNIEQKFCDWLAALPNDKVFDYLERCPLAEFGQSLFPAHRVIGDVDRFIIKDDDYSFRFCPIPKKLSQIIHGCRKEQGETFTILASELKSAVGV